MTTKTWLAALAMSSVGLAALAHSGASGVTRERMDAMDEMGEAMKTLTPVMRGQTLYDAEVVRAAAQIMIGHSGARMTELFPQGSNAKPSEALDAIWQDWEEFAALAEALKTSADGMRRAAGNGLAGPGDTHGAGMMGGGQGMMGGGQGMMAAGPGEMMSAEVLAEMPVNAGFMAVTQTCSACHRKFRAEED